MLSAERFRKTAAPIILVSLLSACGGGGSDDGTIDGNTGGGNPPASNRAPSISGTPPATVMAGQSFSFSPSASDPDGDSLSFTIQNRPAWVTSFNQSTGQMAGTPDNSDVGVYQGITVTVTDGDLSTSLSPFSVEVDDPGSNPPPTNSAPTISGNPANSVLVGDDYAFTPSASDADGDSLSFSIQNRPSWASFNSNTGRLSGTPGAGDVGTYDNIRITVSDGQANATLGAFSITVGQVATGSAELFWDAPTQNTDGSPLTDLVGYAFYYGTQSGNYPNRVEIRDPGITSYVIPNLTPGTYYFVAVSLKSNDTESEYSNEAVKTVQ
ncbi:MAG: putative Ig domain-containing protein [Pseudomonadota bacterium]